MATSHCEVCHERTLRYKQGDAFNATANPMDEGLERMSECETSFHEIKGYFSVYLMRCLRCRTVWLLGYYEDFDARPPMAEWGERTWIWRPLSSKHVAQIEAARGTGALNLQTFAATS